MKVKAKIMNINFYNYKNNYYILKINVKENSNRQIKLKNTTLKGIINTPIAKGDEIEFEASYNKSENNLTLEKLETKKITNAERLANFCVDHTQGISKTTFLKILESNSIDDIMQDNSILDSYKLSKKKKETVLNILSEYKQMESINNLMKLIGASYEQAYAIYSLYALQSWDIISKNPYKLFFANILEWKEADRLASLYSVSDEVKEEALTYKQIHDYCYSLGNVCIPESELQSTPTLTKMIQEGKLKSYKGCIYTNKLFEDERTLETAILNITCNNKYNTIDSTQEEAVKNALNIRISIITGGPGTGKTYTINKIVQELENRNYTCCLLAPTGKAADRLAELTGKQTETIHRKLKLLPYLFDTDEEITEDYIIIDECSMIDLELSACLFTHISDDTKIVLVGDVNQLSSVGAGRVFQDLIESRLIKTTKLNKVYRQSETSGIVKNAYNLLNDEELEYTSYPDFEFIETDDIDEIQEYIKNNINDKTQILSPMHESQLGTDILNLIIQNSDTQGFKELDKVIQNTNDYDLGVFNGNLGTVIDTYEKLVNGEWQNVVKVEFENINKICEYDKKNINEIELAYALTIHKSQGSEFDTVIIPIHQCLDYMLNKNLLYTAFTRAKKHLILIGNKEVFEETRHKEIQRKSNLF